MKEKDLFNLLLWLKTNCYSLYAHVQIDTLSTTLNDKHLIAGQMSKVAMLDSTGGDTQI